MQGALAAGAGEGGHEGGRRGADGAGAGEERDEGAWADPAVAAETGAVLKLEVGAGEAEGVPQGQNGDAAGVP